MTLMEKIVSFDESYLTSLHKAFTHAFSSYKVNFKLSPEEFRIRLYEKSHIDFGLTRLMLKESNVVGFVLHATGKFMDRQFVYNAGTGLIPRERNKGYARELMKSALKRSDELSLPSVLEVIEDNETALKLYDSLGYKPSRRLLCFKGYTAQKKAEETIELRIQHHWELNRYADFLSFHPSFVDTHSQLIFNKKNELIIEAYFEERLAGFIIFQPHLGRISQIAVEVTLRGRGIAKCLLNQALLLSDQKPLSIINIPIDQEQTINSLLALGFRNEINQFEMIREPLNE